MNCNGRMDSASVNGNFLSSELQWQCEDLNLALQDFSCYTTLMLCAREGQSLRTSPKSVLNSQSKRESNQSKHLNRKAIQKLR